MFKRKVSNGTLTQGGDNEELQLWRRYLPCSRTQGCNRVDLGSFWKYEENIFTFSGPLNMVGKPSLPSENIPSHTLDPVTVILRRRNFACVLMLHVVKWKVYFEFSGWSLHVIVFWWLRETVRGRSRDRRTEETWPWEQRRKGARERGTWDRGRTVSRGCKGESRFPQRISGGSRSCRYTAGSRPVMLIEETGFQGS